MRRSAIVRAVVLAGWAVNSIRSRYLENLCVTIGYGLASSLTYSAALAIYILCIPGHNVNLQA